MPCLRWQADHYDRPKFRLAPHLVLTGFSEADMHYRFVVSRTLMEVFQSSGPAPQRAENLHLWSRKSLPSTGACYRALRRLPGRVLHSRRNRVLQDDHVPRCSNRERH
jgi:hypothetical protein